MTQIQLLADIDKYWRTSDLVSRLPSSEDAERQATPVLDSRLAASDIVADTDYIDSDIQGWTLAAIDSPSLSPSPLPSTVPVQEEDGATESRCDRQVCEFCFELVAPRLPCGICQKGMLF